MNQRAMFTCRPRALCMSAYLALLVLGATALSGGVPASRQMTDVFSFADLSNVGSAWLERNDNGVTAKVSVHGTDEGVYTMWWVIWNNPENCITPFACAADDLVNPDAGLAIGYAGGGIASVDGELKIAAHLRAGETLIRFPTSEFQALGFELNETTLIDSRQADVHLFLRSHGEKVKGLVGEALHTFNGACVYDPPIDGSEPVYGVPGPNICQDQFFAVFPSEEAD